LRGWSGGLKGSVAWSTFIYRGVRVEGRQSRRGEIGRREKAEGKRQGRGGKRAG
jgi:hypothetical protein